MKITTAFGDDYEAKQVCVRMVKTLGVEVYLNIDWLDGDEVSEERLEKIAHEEWLETRTAILKAVVRHSRHIDVEFLSTDHVEVEVVE